MKYNTIRTLEKAGRCIEQAQTHLGELPSDTAGTADLLALDHLVKANFAVGVLLQAARKAEPADMPSFRAWWRSLFE